MTKGETRTTNAQDGAREPLTPAVFHILLALADGPLHGYAVMQAVADTGGPTIATGPGTIYGSIGRMQDAGLVAEARIDELAHEPESTGRGRPRKYYRLTDTGHKALRAEAVRLNRLSELVQAKDLLPDEVQS